MRTAPAVRLVVRRSGMWRTAVSAGVLVTAVVGAAWVGRLGGEMPGWGRIAVIGALSACLAAAASTTRMAAMLLHWDGQTWRVGPAAAGDVGACPGSLAAVIDLGPWMLLRFEADAHPGAAGRRIWLPLQRRGLETHWHALRCAVHAPRPALARVPS